MTKLLLSLHVLAAIIAIGPVTVAASMFPATARRAFATPTDTHHLATARTLHRICRVYAMIGLAVPVFGLATAAGLGVLTDMWLTISIALTGVAAGILALVILPGQSRILAAMPRPAAQSLPSTAQLAMFTGTFNLLWAVVTVLMIVRPGSTTGA
ncbi:hypothetical protein OG874_28885 [Nocardia sp. NBC_00565]|uniref:hypothetical protein n=1 Tax=Nocardia sp. NBC_00565 TaxID=2975993 RepID=UPI002E823FD1|nr:hypothetical protein [Nocardia sp. NBC_00565]WUC00840.1 hypothetical protein OG874_28885 [Nocardia sp. NBC_00565]